LDCPNWRLGRIREHGHPPGRGRRPRRLKCARRSDRIRLGGGGRRGCNDSRRGFGFLRRRALQINPQPKEQRARNEEGDEKLQCYASILHRSFQLCISGQDHSILVPAALNTARQPPAAREIEYVVIGGHRRIRVQCASATRTNWQWDASASQPQKGAEGAKRNSSRKKVQKGRKRIHCGRRTMRRSSLATRWESAAEQWKSPRNLSLAASD